MGNTSILAVTNTLAITHILAMAKMMLRIADVEPEKS
jgi:hypothetical protein